MLNPDDIRITMGQVMVIYEELQQSYGGPVDRTLELENMLADILFMFHYELASTTEKEIHQ